jgi:DNA-binding LacI/PurR family transcriptional regulator
VVDVGLACPQQVSVIGFDDYSWTRHHTPKLTVMAQPTYEMGKRAMEMLLSRMNGNGESARSVLLNAELRVRESTAPPMVQ